MSIILEALKKSEHQRQRQSGPGFATVPERAASGERSMWPVLIIILLALNTVILAFFLLRGGQAPATGQDPDRADESARASAPAADPGAARDRPPVSQPTRTATLTAPRPPTAAQDSGTVRPREVRPLQREIPDRTSVAPTPPASPSSPRATPAIAADPPQAYRADGTANQLPSATELYLRGELSGLPLHLDLHVYYADAARRVVFINGRKYREGERLSSGQLVTEIVPEGVILTDGTRDFLLRAE